MGVAPSWPMVVNSGVRGRVLATQRASEGVADRHTDTFRPFIIVTVGSRALSFSDPYIHFACLSVRHSVILSFCLSATSELNISETRTDSGMVTMDGLYKLAYGLSIGLRMTSRDRMTS